MKKFIKKVGFILSIPLVWLLVIYNIPTFLLDYIINWLRSTSNMANIIRCWKLLKFGVISLYNNKDVTLESTIKAYNKDEWIIFNSTKIKVNEKKKQLIVKYEMQLQMNMMELNFVVNLKLIHIKS